MKIPTLQDMSRFDKMLYDLAAYDVAKGAVLTTSSQEASYELHQRIFERFNYFKLLIKTNECNMAFLQYTILRKYSALTDAEFIAKYGEYHEGMNKYYMLDEDEQELNKIMSFIVSNPVYKKMLLDPLEDKEDREAKEDKGKKPTKRLPKKNQEPNENTEDKHPIP